MADISWIGLNELKSAVARNPQKVLSEARLFLSRGLAVYKRSIIRAPWRIGGDGGGSPVAARHGGNLRDTHLTEINGLEGRIGPNQTAAPYARYVHEGTRKMQGRPWLDYARVTGEGEIQTLYREMLGNITSNLAR